MSSTRNFNAAPIDLYDLTTPTDPRWFTVRRAILMHRDEKRKPVPFSARGREY